MKMTMNLNDFGNPEYDIELPLLCRSAVRRCSHVWCWPATHVFAVLIASGYLKARSILLLSIENLWRYYSFRIYSYGLLRYVIWKATYTVSQERFWIMGAGIFFQFGAPPQSVFGAPFFPSFTIDSCPIKSKSNIATDSFLCFKKYTYFFKIILSKWKFVWNFGRMFCLLVWRTFENRLNLSS